MYNTCCKIKEIWYKDTFWKSLSWELKTSILIKQKNNFQKTSRDKITVKYQILRNPLNYQNKKKKLIRL